MTDSKRLIISISLAALFLAGGCSPTSTSTAGYGLNTTGTGPIKAPDNQEQFLLRYSFSKDQLRRYFMDFRMNSTGAGRIEDHMQAVIYQTCLGGSGEGPSSKFYRLNIVRREIQRTRKERDKTGRNLPPLIATRTDEPDITPNYGYDNKYNKNFFPVDSRGIFGISKERPFHRVVYDSLVYLLPVLPPAKVRTGSVWSIDIPVYAGPDYFYPTEQYRRGNDFKLSMNGRIDRIYYRGEEAFAEISWEASGTFDTQAFPDRFPNSFHNHQRIIHEVRSTGNALFNVTKGVLVRQNGQSTITLTSRYLITERDRNNRITGHDWDEAINRHILHYKCQLLGDDEPDPRPNLSR
jgi:hypothetical protein